jgi:hypothetical protein
MSTQTCPIPDNFDVMQFLVPKARLIGPSESIPAELEVGFEQLGKLDRDWCWVWSSGGEVRGVLLAAPCHGAAMIWRVSVLPGESAMAVTRLLKRFLSDIQARGCSGYLTLVDTSKPIQGRLKGIIEKNGGKAFGPYDLMAAPVKGEECL